MSRCLSFALLLAGADGARVARRRGAASQLFSGVRVHAYRPDADDWLVLFEKDATNADISKFCGGTCSLVGNPDQGGVAFASVHGMNRLESMVSTNSAKIQMLEPDNTDYLIPEVLDEPEAASWGLERIGVPTRTHTGRGQTIYVQDTGVRWTHNDFGGRASAGIDLTTGRGLEVCAADTTTCSMDRQGHGTHCASIAAGTVYGVASEANVKALKTLSDQGSGARSWQMAAIDWVTATGKKPSIISMSLGGSGADPSYTRAIGAATAVGVTVVVAGGNSNSDSCNFSPAFAEDAITVGSTDSNDHRSSFSNYGSCTNIWAPGSSITAADAGGDSGSRSLSGTSMACPHVSGGAALLLEADQSLKRDGILAILYENAATDVIHGLRPEDTNKLLYVGEGGAPPSPAVSPTPAPPGQCLSACRPYHCAGYPQYCGGCSFC